jgi:hypothetical protein
LISVMKIDRSNLCNPFVNNLIEKRMCASSSLVVNPPHRNKICVYVFRKNLGRRWYVHSLYFHFEEGARLNFGELVNSYAC